MQYAIPKPKGGRHAQNLILREDQWKAENEKLHRSNKKDDPDNLFAESLKKQAAKNLVVGYGKKNPNVSRRKFGKKNKTKMQQ